VSRHKEDSRDKTPRLDTEQTGGRSGDGWRDVPRAGMILTAGNAEQYETGDWRTHRPVWRKGECIQCRLCWAFCPDSAIMVNEEGEITGIDYDHCKGCGICVAECPKEALVMEKEE